MTAPAQESLRRFVRDTLGCGCPVEVLEAIRLEAAPGPPVSRWRLDVGGRLLVWVVGVDRTSASAVVAECLRAGVEERDRLGFNRFRLVVAVDDPQAERSARASFDHRQPADERVHLHLLVPELVPPALRT